MSNRAEPHYFLNIGVDNRYSARYSPARDAPLRIAYCVLTIAYCVLANTYWSIAGRGNGAIRLNKLNLLNKVEPSEPLNKVEQVEVNSRREFTQRSLRSRCIKCFKLETGKWEIGIFARWFNFKTPRPPFSLTTCQSGLAVDDLSIGRVR